MNKIVPLKKNANPARPLHSLKQISADADVLVSRYTEICDLYDRVRKKIEAMPHTSAQLDQLFARAKITATLSERDEILLRRCTPALRVFDAAEYYEDDNLEGRLRRSVIGERVAMLVGAFPNGATSDPSVYVRMMIEGVSAIDELILPALDAAVFEIVATQKFLPTISEVLQVVNAQRLPWNEKSWAIRALADESIRVLGWLEELRLETQRQWRKKA